MGHAGNPVALTRGAKKLEDGTMSTSDGVQKRNAFAACAAFRIERLEASLNQAREIAVQEELDAVGRHIEEAHTWRRFRSCTKKPWKSSAGRRENKPVGNPRMTAPPRR